MNLSFQKEEFIMTNTENSYGDTSAARLGANHGYRILGELACINAELAIANDVDAFARQWALQLWACDAPYGGGTLFGTKVAEATLDVASDPYAQPQQLYTETLARLPASGRDYSMVLVLASGQAGTFDRVHDFANYPGLERFSAPYLEGSVGYSIEGDSVVVEAERVINPRAAENSLSSLALELWALYQPYAGEQFAGAPLAGVQLGSLPGQQSFENVEWRLAFTPPPAGESWNVALMLREWTTDGYVTRDYRNFAAPLVWGFEAPQATQPVALESEKPAPAVLAAKPVVAAAAAAVAAKPSAAVETVVAVKPAAAVEAVVAAKPAVVTEAAAVAKPATTVEAVVAAKTVVVKDAAVPAKPAAAPVAAVKPPTALLDAAAKLASATAPAVIAAVPPVLAKSEAPAAKRLEAAAPQRAKDAALVSIQTATLDELSVVKGLNKKLASEIIKARPFRSLDELTRVRGIGDNLLRRLRTELTV
jgi:DNA uptake protein ComE-like DNA-binding protein